ncbi:hypothetical protein VCRA2119O147_2880002 [Vibrio crassostreae]|nr:hypothetical protein VCRA2119O145_190002 [Vibrio crassostreae]CAK1811783.1 hypothetical protein VCRA2118O144_190002 [Vibrio crassostreae]CAK2299846.1 hypothetical protein VCRA2117O143_190002 [Vibrio crassostreae]CAK2315629.1 hypothetical protein VCRA2117O142_220002 [Vibrio crassostreae]CAK2328472.1 hypothetical protein VCRA2119O147_2880002 [Vibrio crassostreae]
MFALSTAVASVRKKQIKSTLAKSQHRAACYQRASLRKVCWLISSWVNTSTPFHFIVKKPCLSNRVSSYLEPRWIVQVSEHFTPLYQALHNHLLKQVVVQADETPLNVLKEEKKCYMWVYCSGADSPEAKLKDVKNIVLFDYQNGRSRVCPEGFLGDYGGYLQTDGYKVYDGLTEVKHLGCLAHARRKFMDAKKLQGKGKTGKADTALAKIQKLYALETRLKGKSAEEKVAERQEVVKPMLDDLHKWLTSQKVVESSQLGKAIKYTVGQWPKLIRYVEDGHLSIDNNRAERAVKSMVIGRKIGSLPIPLKVRMLVLCCTASSKRQRLMV